MAKPTNPKRTASQTVGKVPAEIVSSNPGEVSEGVRKETSVTMTNGTKREDF